MKSLKPLKLFSVVYAVETVFRIPYLHFYFQAIRPYICIFQRLHNIWYYNRLNAKTGESNCPPVSQTLKKFAKIYSVTLFASIFLKRQLYLCSKIFKTYMKFLLSLIYISVFISNMLNVLAAITYINKSSL